MDTLHTVLRTIRGETKGDTGPRPDHITVFREFLNQLERINRKGTRTPRAPRRTKPKAARGKR